MKPARGAAVAALVDGALVQGHVLRRRSRLSSHRAGNPGATILVGQDRGRMPRWVRPSQLVQL